MPTKILHKDYTKLGSAYQLVLPLNTEILIPRDAPVRLVRYAIGGMNLEPLYRTYSHLERNKATPRQMLEILVLAGMKGIRSSRAIEEECRKNIDFMYLLEGKKAPDYATVARFRSLHLAPCCRFIFAQMDQFLADIGELSGENLFIDGTKIESSANKYKFVWRKAVSKNLQKMMDKIPAFFAETEETFGIKVRHGEKLRKHHLKKLLKKLLVLKKETGAVFVHGRGQRKTPLQRAVEQLQNYLFRLKDYQKKLHLCGKRSSYAKTDHDATFMRLKEDAMRNGQLKPAYNIQFGVDAEYVVWVSEGPQPGDVTALIPFLEDFQTHTRFSYRNIIADAGYESLENYVYLENRGLLSYIKPADYEIKKKRGYKQDIGRRENMHYDAEEDYYTCANGKKIVWQGTIKKKSRTGFIDERAQYACHECSGCPLKEKCIHGRNSKKPMAEREKHFEVSKAFQEKRDRKSVV